jgi:hypothetical protein
VNKLILTLASCAALAACATPGVPNTPAQTVYAAEGTYAAALNLAVAYRNLPVCGTAGVTVCHDPAVVQELVRANGVARSDLAEAETLVRSTNPDQTKLDQAIAAAEVAVQAFAQIAEGVKLK